MEQETTCTRLVELNVSYVGLTDALLTILFLESKMNETLETVVQGSW